MATKKPSVKELTAKLQGVSAAAKSLGIDTSKADAMVKQTDRQGSKSFAGSKEEKAYTQAQAKDPAGGVGVISSNRGKNLVKEADKTMARFTPDPLSAGLTPEQQKNEDAAQAIRFGTGTNTGTAKPEAAQPDTSKDFITYYNESTGQEQTLRGSAINDANKAALEGKGYTLATSDTSNQAETPEITKAKTELATADKQMQAYMTRLESTLVSDKELASEIRGIKSTYAARIQEAEEITARREQMIQTLGARTGARYTGGMGGVLGGLISEEERQGLMRIESIENDKQGAILDAKKAARDNNFSLYTKLMDIADRKQEQKSDELKTLKEAQRVQSEKLEGERKRVETESYIAELMNSGVKDPMDIYTQLAAAGKLGDYTLSDILGIAGALDNIEYMNPKKAAAGTAGSSYSEVPTDGYDITQGFNFGKAKTADYKNLARELFPGDFGNKLLVELTDEELIEFIKDYTDDVNAAQSNIDPESYYLDWAEKLGAVKSEDTSSSFTKKLEELKATYK
jgi:hypothetical protein